MSGTFYNKEHEYNSNIYKTPGYIFQRLQLISWLSDRKLKWENYMSQTSYRHIIETKTEQKKNVRHILVLKAHDSQRIAGSVVKHHGSLFGLLEGVRQKFDASSSVSSGNTSAVVTSWEWGVWSTHLWHLRPLRVMLTWPRYLGFVGREIHTGSPPVNTPKKWLPSLCS